MDVPFVVLLLFSKSYCLWSVAIAVVLLGANITGLRHQTFHPLYLLRQLLEELGQSAVLV